MNKKIIIGNWKMNPQNTKEAEKLFNDTTKSLYNIKKTEIIICPPYLYLDKLNKISLSSRAKKVKKVYLGAQNVFQGNTGAHTGEISVKMLYEMGIKYVILGHSERRNTEMGIGENNNDINQKIKSVFSFNIIPILC
ncbi:MAG: triose-phosphate isomerase family protein, partial [Patescibacteria group bacterium]